MAVIRAYEPLRGAEELAEVFALRKGRWTVSCRLATHALGWELRTTLNGELHRSQVCRTDAEVLDTYEGWRAAWQAKGWTAD